jgi:hypothetical protein
MNPNQPNVFMAPNGNFWDNKLIPAAPFFTTNGIGFDFNGDQFVLFSGVTGNPLSEGLSRESQNVSYIGTLTVTETPQPSTLGLLFGGLLLAGATRFASHREAQRSPAV